MSAASFSYWTSGKMKQWWETIVRAVSDFIILLNFESKRILIPMLLDEIPRPN